MRYVLAFMALLLFIPGHVIALTPTITGTPVSSSFVSENSHTVTLDTTGAGSNKVLIFWTGFFGQSVETTGSVVAGGVAMTKIYNQSGSQQSSGEMWCLAAPVSSSSMVVVITPSSPPKAGFATGAVYQDARQDCSTIVDTSGTANGVGTGDDTKQVTTSFDGDIVTQWIIPGVAATGITPDSPQTAVGSEMSNVNAKADISNTPQTTAGAITTGFTYTGVAAYDLYVVALRGAASAVSAPPIDQGLTWFD